MLMWARALRALAFTGMAATLTGCVGMVINTPEKSFDKIPEGYPQARQEAAPRVSGTERSWEQREWCGIKVVIAVVPIPLQLPLCTSYHETSYSSDAEGRPIVLRATQTLTARFYGCGPLMVLGPIMQSYRGNMFCGTFKW